MLPLCTSYRSHMKTPAPLQFRSRGPDVPLICAQKTVCRRTGLLIYELQVLLTCQILRFNNVMQMWRRQKLETTRMLILHNIMRLATATATAF